MARAVRPWNDVAVGFDQYHEPAEELSAETRTFARLCASLTEEAEAIGWYEQRMSVEADRDARAIMADTQGEEFKHFCMDLEFLMRRTPLWREIAQGILFQDGDIVEHGEESEEAATEDAVRPRRARLPRRVARHRQPPGGRAMSHLLRGQAPITETSWDLLDAEARERLAPALAARRLVDFSGPHGWEHSATNLGRTEELTESVGDGVAARQRRVLPLVELRARFSIARSELEDADRGADDVDLDPLATAARQIATAENAAVFHGWDAAGITGIDATPNERIELGEDCERYPRHVAVAVDALREAGVQGPYGLALGPEAHTRVLETSEHGGYPLFEHLGQILDGPIVWAPAVQGGVVLSLRGGDFLFESGQDLSIGYESDDGDAVHLYLEESFSFRVATPEAAVALPG